MNFKYLGEDLTLQPSIGSWLTPAPLATCKNKQQWFFSNVLKKKPKQILNGYIINIIFLSSIKVPLKKYITNRNSKLILSAPPFLKASGMVTLSHP